MSFKPSSILGSKWEKTKLLLQNSSLSLYIPDTTLYTFEDLQDMLNKHGMVYIKPDKGSGGKGVLKALKRSKHSYILQYESTTQKYPSVSELYDGINNVKLDKPYIIQQGIQLLRYKKRITDIRIVVQRNESDEWEVTGMIGRRSHPRRIVTNFHADGQALPVERILKPYLTSSKSRTKMLKKLTLLSIKVGNEFLKENAAFHELGLDIGLDKSLHPWILEVNTRPNSIIFDQLKDKSMLNRMLELKHRNERPVSPISPATPVNPVNLVRPASPVTLPAPFYPVIRGIRKGKQKNRKALIR